MCEKGFRQDIRDDFPILIPFDNRKVRTICRFWNNSFIKFNVKTQFFSNIRRRYLRNKSHLIKKKLLEIQMTCILRLLTLIEVIYMYMVCLLLSASKRKKTKQPPLPLQIQDAHGSHRLPDNFLTIIIYDYTSTLL